MTVSRYLRTIDLATAAQISVQQVRNYEASGFIPPAERSKGGYRLYTKIHLAALTTTRSLVTCYTWQRVQQIMQAVHQRDLPTALALIDERQAELAHKRLHIEQILAALRSLSGQTSQPHTAVQPPPLRIGEAAAQVGVRVSAIHFWEQQGLLKPSREQSSRYRLYDQQQMRRLQIIVLLREGGYNFEVIQTTLDELAAGQPERAIAAVEKRYAELASTSWSCLQALAAFQSYVGEFWPDLTAALG